MKNKISQFVKKINLKKIFIVFLCLVLVLGTILPAISMML